MIFLHVLSYVSYIFGVLINKHKELRCSRKRSNCSLPGNCQHKTTEGETSVSTRDWRNLPVRWCNDLSKARLEVNHKISPIKTTTQVKNGNYKNAASTVCLPALNNLRFKLFKVNIRQRQDSALYQNALIISQNEKYRY